MCYLVFAKHVTAQRRVSTKSYILYDKLILNGY